jgi:hypothetical protein
MADGVYVRARVFAQFQSVDGGRNHVAIGNAVQLFVRLVDGDIDFRKTGKDRHACEDFLTQINYLKHP